MTPSFHGSGPADSGTQSNLTPVSSPRPDHLYEQLEAKISSLAATVAHWQRDLDTAVSRSSRLEGAFSVLLSSLEGWKSDIREVASRTESRVLRGLEVIDSRIARVQPASSHPDPALVAAVQKLQKAFEERIGALEAGAGSGDTARLLERLDRLESRLQAIGEKVSAPDVQLSNRLGEAVQILDQRLQAIEQKALAQGSDLPLRLAESTGNLERRIAEGQQRLEEAVRQAAASHNTEAVEQRIAQTERKIQETLSKALASQPTETLQESLRSVERKLTDIQEALTRKLDSVLAESDDNNATQLRYLAGLEELQATVAKRIQSLEGIIANPLDAQQWERLAKGLEFLDTKLAQSYDSVANRLDTAIAALTATLDNRAAVTQEANLKTAERLWRALRGLEDQITGSYQMVRQSQERLETASQNVSGALEELRAVTGARAGHTEKLLMEGLETLDRRFSQNLMAVSEGLSSALFALNKATGEWRSELFNATEESEERVVGRISQSEAKLAGELKSGLDALGRREERMLALILGGGAPLPLGGAVPSPPTKKESPAPPPSQEPKQTS